MRLSLPAAVLGVLVGLMPALSGSSAAAATMSLSNPVVATGGDVSGSGNFSLNGSGTEGDPYKISGSGSFSNTGVGTITVSVSGTVSANAGDIFSVYFDTTYDLTGGTASYSINGLASIPLVPLDIPFVSGSIDQGSNEYTGSQQAESPTNLSSTDFTAELLINWSGTGNLTVEIPSSSIDISLSAAPEPGCIGLISAALFLPRRRHRSLV
jgi:hypothetical protein